MTSKTLHGLEEGFRGIVFCSKIVLAAVSRQSVYIVVITFVSVPVAAANHGMYMWEQNVEHVSVFIIAGK